MTTEEERIGSGSNTQTTIEGWILHFFAEYEKVALDDMPDFSIGIPVEFENQCTGTKKKLEIIGNWLSVSKVDDYAYKPDFALAIIDEQENEYEYKYEDVSE